MMSSPSLPPCVLLYQVVSQPRFVLTRVLKFVPLTPQPRPFSFFPCTGLAQWCQSTGHNRGRPRTCSINLVHQAVHYVTQGDDPNSMHQATGLATTVPGPRPRSSHSLEEDVEDTSHRLMPM